MDGNVRAEKLKNPRQGANIFSALTFTWVLRTFWVGYRRDLEISDLYTPLKEHKSSVLGDKISKIWNQELEKLNKKQSRKTENARNRRNEELAQKPVQPSLTLVLIKCFGAKVMLYGIALAIMEIILRINQPRFLRLLIRYYRPLNIFVPVHRATGSESTSKPEDAPKSIAQPLFLARLLKFYNKMDELEDKQMPLQEAYLYAVGVIMCSAINIFVVHPYMMAILHMGMKMRIACCSLIYRKALKLSRTALGETTIGQAVNLLSNDVSRFDVAIIFLHYLWLGPLETVIITYFMYREVGISAVFGVAALLMFIPLQGFLGKLSSDLRLKTAIRTDERVRLTNEIITGIQAIKMYTWEKPFSDLIEKARKKEINVIRATSYIRGVIMSFIIFTTRLSLFVTVLTYVLSGENITAEKVFMLTAYYNILRQNMTVFFPQGITQVAEAMVSIKRLQNFMMYDEMKEQDKNTKGFEKFKIIEDLENNSLKKEKSDEATLEVGSVNIENASAKWLASDKDDSLKNMNIKVTPGELIAIVGQVGTGKSSLLNLILRELPLHTGSIQVNGSIAYASQEPWLFAGSVRQNILFGKPMDQRRYDKVVKVCQLKRDFQLLPYGDKTIVGERGVSLSGGQRARVNLARAVYADVPIYLFDDPLSAVDAHVGKHMFDECISKYLHNKTRILVTHQLQYLRNVNRIIVLKDGAIKAEGTYDELGAMGVDFGRLLQSQAPNEEQLASSAPVSRSTSRNASISSMSSFNSHDGRPEGDPEQVAEMRTKGSVSGKIYAGYFGAGGNWCFIFIVFALFVLAQLAASGSDFFIAEWVNREESYNIKLEKMNKTEESQDTTAQPDETPEEPPFRDSYIYIYAGITIATIVVTLVRSFSFYTMCMRASMRLHDQMFRSISEATMRFFNTNTSGRILNRFSKDMGAIDELLPIALIDCLQIGLALIGIIVVVGIANPLLMVPTFLIGIIFYFLRVFYLATSRSVKRLEGVTRSPVFAHLNASLQGLPTIRSFGAGEILCEEFDNHQDLHSSAWYIFIASSRAFGFWLDVFCLIYIALVTLSFLVMSGDDSKAMGGNVGLAITQSIGLTGMFQWGMRQSAELENQMTSVERVLEYSKVEKEPPLESTPDKKPKQSWPEEGKIVFSNVSLNYSPLDPPVLKNLNFAIQPREKIGIVGRTGAGKSSLIQALFRLANVEGRIEIDNVETGEIGLHDLRDKISIIPQEPFLFSGTLRSNLDPFDTYPDNVLWQALEEVELKEMGLESHMNEGGSNLSVGQRQLVCLARAIVRNTPILVLDEATANVDPRTDELIQRTIRSKFARCTVLTIAHRLNTVMDSDRILVMDAGTAVEFDQPHLLLEKESGFLLSMVRETGNQMAEALARVARESYLQRSMSQTFDSERI